MKKQIFIAALMIVSVISCKKKDDSSDEAVTPAANITAVPASFSPKVILEEFTGAWCGYCPRGADQSDKIVLANPGKFFPVAIHAGGTEVMKIAAGNSIDSIYNDYGYPGGMINRVTVGSSATLATNYWSSKTTAQLALVPDGGLAIDASKIENNILTLDVHAGFKSAITGDLRLIVYLVEKSVINASTAYDQHNYMSSSGSSPDPSSPFYNQPPIIHNFEHKHVLRKVISSSSVWGDAIPAANIGAGKEFVKTYLVNLGTYVPANMQIVAFIDKNSGTKINHQVINVQAVTVGTFKNWD